MQSRIYQLTHYLYRLYEGTKDGVVYHYRNPRNPCNPRQSAICGVRAQMRPAFRQEPIVPQDGNHNPANPLILSILIQTNKGHHIRHLFPLDVLMPLTAEPFDSLENS